MSKFGIRTAVCLGLLAAGAIRTHAQDLNAGAGIKGWFVNWENTPQGIKSEDSLMYGFSGMLQYKRLDLSASWLDGDFDLEGKNLDASREEVRIALGYSVTDYLNVFVGLSDLQGEAESSETEFVTNLVGFTNDVPVVQGSTRQNINSRKYELFGIYAGIALNAPLGESGLFAYATASVQPMTSITVNSVDLDDGLGTNFEAGLGYLRNHISAKLGYRLEMLDNDDNYDEQLQGIVLVAGVAL